MRTKLLAVGAGLALATAIVIPAYAASSASLTATVLLNIPAAPDACISLDSATIAFNTVTALTTNEVENNVKRRVLTNCGGSAGLKFSATNATGGTVTWQPSTSGACNTGVNKYRIDVQNTSGTAAIASINTTPQDYRNGIPAASTDTLDFTFTQACRGSTIPPIGTTLTFTINIAATLL
jgi:hypothetical protein